MSGYAPINPTPPDRGSRLTQLNTELNSAKVERTILGKIQTTSKTAYTSQKIFQEIRECKKERLNEDQIQTAIQVVQKTKELFSAKAFHKAGIEKEADSLIADLTLLLSDSNTATISQVANRSFRSLQQWASDLENAAMQTHWKGRYVVIKKVDGAQETISAKEIHHLIQEIKEAISSGNLKDELCIQALDSLQKLQQMYEKTNSLFFRNTRNKSYQELQNVAETIIATKASLFVPQRIQAIMQDVLACHQLTMLHAVIFDRNKINYAIIAMVFPEITQETLKDFESAKKLLNLITGEIQKYTAEKMHGLDSGEPIILQDKKGIEAKKLQNKYRETSKVRKAHTIGYLQGIDVTTIFIRDIQNPPFPSQFSGKVSDVEGLSQGEYENLAKKFVEDLKQKLGPSREGLYLEILKLLDQNFRDDFSSAVIKPYLQSLVIERPNGQIPEDYPLSCGSISPSPQRIEIQIQITKDKVFITQICDYEQQQTILENKKCSYELCSKCGEYPLQAQITEGTDRQYLDIGYPIRVTSQVVLGTSDEDMEFSIQAQKLDRIEEDPSTQYPIVSSVS